MSNIDTVLCQKCKTEQSDSGWADAVCFDHRETRVATTPDDPTPDDPTPDDLLYEAWGLIANACGGDWDKADKASPGWKGAAERWRDKWYKTLGEKREETFTRSEVLQLLGQWGLPPWADHDGAELGGKVDCAVLAEQIAASVDAVLASKS